MINLTNTDIQNLVFELSIIIENKYYDSVNKIKIYGVPRGGIPVAYILSAYVDSSIVIDDPEDADIIIDDLVDSGSTKERYSEYNGQFYALIDKRVQKEYDDWIVFPWEQVDKETPIEDNIERICQYLKGDNKIEDKQNIAHQLQDIMEKILEVKE